MATSNVRNIFTNPGRLFMNPTSLTVEANFGTELGLFRRVVMTVEQPYQWVTAEEHGGQKVEGIITGEGLTIGALLHSWDADALGQIFPNTATGAAGTSGKTFMNVPGTVRPGEKMSVRALVLYFVPDDIERRPCMLMRRALPATQETFDVAQRIDEEHGIPVVFTAIRDTSDNLYDWGFAHDLTL
ncbi:hypothetical protein [uncultured Mediterranean phage]|nr:hypothetical protein [uncultured Mediterranean phage]